MDRRARVGRRVDGLVGGRQIDRLDAAGIRATACPAIGNSGWISLARCAGTALVGYARSRSLFNSTTRR